MKISHIAFSILLLLLVLGVRTLYGGEEIRWLGEETREIAVRVLSAESREQIANALVRLSSPSNYPIIPDDQLAIERTTDDSGWATLQAVFEAEGYGLAPTKKDYWVMCGWLEVEQDGYEKAADWLANFTGYEGQTFEDDEVHLFFPLTTDRVEVTVLLKRKGQLNEPLGE